MPKEKNSAAPAISPAVSAARGTSIIVPIVARDVDALGLGDLGEHPLGLLADRLQLLHGADQRDHDLRARVAAGLLALGGRLGDRPHLHGEQPGDDEAEPHAAQAEHRVLLVHAPARPRSSRSVPSSCSPRASATATRTDSSVRSGRNSCSGGSSSRTVTGRPSIASKISTKSCFCSGSSCVERRVPLLVVRRRGSASRPAAGARRGTCARCGTGRCPARRTAGRARRPRGCRRWSRTPSRRFPSAWARIRCTLRTRSSASSASGAISPSKYATTAGGSTGTSPRHTRPVEPSMEMTSPSSTTVPSGRGELLLLGVDLQLLGAAHAGLAHAAGDDGGVRGLAAAAGQDALGGDHAGQVVGVGLPADQDDLLAAAAHFDRGRRSRRRPCRRRRPARRSCPGSSCRASPLVVEPREHQLRELVAGDPPDGLVHVDEALVDQLRGDARTPRPPCACRRGSAASTACRARW